MAGDIIIALILFGLTWTVSGFTAGGILYGLLLVGSAWVLRLALEDSRERKKTAYGGTQKQTPVRRTTAGSSFGSGASAVNDDDDIMEHIMYEDFGDMW